MTVCHSVPCSIDHSGRAPIDTYFRPTVVIASNDDDATPSHQAATLRGRGLLAHANPMSVQGHIIDSSNGRIEGKFSAISEWHHTHLPSAVPNINTPLTIAKDWVEVAAAVHAPLD